MHGYNCNVSIQELNLSYVANLTDAALHRLLTTPRDSRPGLLDKKSRLKNLKKLSLKNTEITDVSLRYISQYLPQVDTDFSWSENISKHNYLLYYYLSYAKFSSHFRVSQLQYLALSSCWKLTDAGLAQLGGEGGDCLAGLDLSSCRALSDTGLARLQACTGLTRIDATNTQITADGLSKFVSKSKQKLKVYGGSVVDRKPAAPSRRSRK